MKVIYKYLVQTAPFKALEKHDSFYAIKRWKPDGTSLWYFQTDRYNVRTLSESEIVSIEE